MLTGTNKTLYYSTVYVYGLISALYNICYVYAFGGVTNPTKWSLDLAVSICQLW